MSISKQRLHKIKIIKLKNIIDLEINLENHNLTAILGVNGCGKSTVIHALACCYKPSDQNEANYRFKGFFIPTTHSVWKGSELTIIHSFRDEKEEKKKILSTFIKRDRWTLYERRTPRHVSFIGVTTCVPMIEKESKKV
jgi:predicted ATP-binding protein involved in virulence